MFSAWGYSEGKGGVTGGQQTILLKHGRERARCHVRKKSDARRGGRGEGRGECDGAGELGEDDGSCDQSNGGQESCEAHVDGEEGGGGGKGGGEIGEMMTS